MLNMNKDLLNVFKKRCEEFGKIFDIKPEYLYIANVNGKMVLCYGPWQLVNTCVDLSSLAVIGYVEYCEDRTYDEEVNYAGFYIMDQYQDTYTSFDLETEKNLVKCIENPEAFDEGIDYFGIPTDNWEKRRESYYSAVGKVL